MESASWVWPVWARLQSGKQGLQRRRGGATTLLACSGLEDIGTDSEKAGRGYAGGFIP